MLSPSDFVVMSVVMLVVLLFLLVLDVVAIEVFWSSWLPSLSVHMRV